MKVIFLTPGTGSFYCGNCLRDANLAKGLSELGHDVSIIPLYLPIVSELSKEFEEEALSMGGVNVYLQEQFSLFRYSPKWLDNLFDSKTVVGLAAYKAGMTEAKDLGRLSVSMLQGVRGRQRKEIKKLIDRLKNGTKPDVIFLSNALLLGLAEPLKKNLGSKIILTLQGATGFVDSLDEKSQKEVKILMRQCCSFVDEMIAVSHFYKDKVIKNFSFEASTISVVHNGIVFEKISEKIKSDKANFTLGFLSRLCPAKGALELAQVFVQLLKKEFSYDLKLVLAGSFVKGDQVYLDEIKQLLIEHNCINRCQFLLNINEEAKKQFLSKIDVLSVPVQYDDSFGLYALEAWSAGVPVVLPDVGAFPELIELSEGGLLFDANNQESLADCLADLIQDSTKARKMALSGRRSVEELFNNRTMALQVEEIIKK